MRVSGSPASTARLAVSRVCRSPGPHGLDGPERTTPTEDYIEKVPPGSGTRRLSQAPFSQVRWPSQNRDQHHSITTTVDPGLELVRRFRAKGVSLQRVRKLESELKRQYPKIVRPMAYDVFYTDGSGIWHQLNPDDDTVVEEIVGRRPRHYAWTPAIRTFADEIRYEPDKALPTEERAPRMAAAWNLSGWVEINPAIQFGAPIVRGTRIPISAIIADLGSGSPEDVAEWRGLHVKQVEDVRDYFVAAA